MRANLRLDFFPAKKHPKNNVNKNVWEMRHPTRSWKAKPVQILWNSTWPTLNSRNSSDCHYVCPSLPPLWEGHLQWQGEEGSLWDFNTMYKVMPYGRTDNKQASMSRDEHRENLLWYGRLLREPWGGSYSSRCERPLAIRVSLHIDQCDNHWDAQVPSSKQGLDTEAQARETQHIGRDADGKHAEKTHQCLPLRLQSDLTKLNCPVRPHIWLYRAQRFCVISYIFKTEPHKCHNSQWLQGIKMSMNFWFCVCNPLKERWCLVLAWWEAMLERKGREWVLYSRHNQGTEKRNRKAGWRLNTQRRQSDK